MKLNYDRKSKDPTYFIQHGFRIGKKTTTRNVVRLGKHSELLKITDDPLGYAKEQVAKYNAEIERNKVNLELRIDFDEKLKFSEQTVSRSDQRNIGYFYLQSIYQKLGISSFFKSILKGRKIIYDADCVNRFLTFARILDPDSKLGTYERLGYYFEQPSFNYMHISRTMDLMYEHYNDYLRHLFIESGKIARRDTSVCYYDCTNFFFETESEDEDYIDEVTGETVKGLRKYGVSKEHRPNPIVQMGLFMDGRGIPLSMCIGHGSNNEQNTVVPMEGELLRMFGGKEFIYCADAGLNSYNIRSFNSMGDRKFVVTQSVKKLSEELQGAVFDDRGFRLLSNDESISVKKLKELDKKDEENLCLYNDRAYKIINADRAEDLGLYEYVELEDGRTRRVKAKGVLRQDIIVTFSRKLFEYQRSVRKRQIERAKRIIKTNPENYRKGPNDITRFIKRVSSSKDENIYVIDQETVEKEEKYDGYYAVATNLENSAKAVLEINAQRYKIEDCFRIMKNSMMARPLFHRTRERITAHFMICYTALLIYRLLEATLEDCGFHFTVDNIIETLRNMEVCNLEDICYRASYKIGRAHV